MRVVLTGPADARAVAAAVAPGLLTQLRDVVGYAARPVETLARGLVEAGVEVELVTLSPSVSAPVVLREGGLTVLIGQYRRSGRARDFFREERRELAELLASTRGEVVHAHWTYEFAWAALGERRPLVVTVHDAPLTIVRRMPDLYRAVRAAMAYRVRAGRFTGIAVSPYVAGRWKRQMLDPRVLRVIPDPIAVGARRSASPGGAGRRVVCLGNASRLKNVRSLLRAFPAVLTAHPDAALVLIGPGLESDGPLAGWTAAHGLSRNVSWLGALDHESTLDRLAEADLAVHPSLEESFGMAVAEAMAVGLPVVGGRRSGAVPWLLGGGAGVLADVRSPASLAAAVRSLLADGVLRRRLAAKATDRARLEFSIPTVVEQHLATYTSVRR